MDRMFREQENCFYYITTMNENYLQPAKPEGADEGIIAGLYPVRESGFKGSHTVQLMGAGTILREVEMAADILEKDFGVAANVWSMTSVNQLAREAREVVRWNRLHPTAQPKVPFLTQELSEAKGPVIAATDYQRAYVDQLREFIPGDFVALGTDGFGRSDTRQRLRQFFEVSREFIVLASLKALADRGEIDSDQVAKAIRDLNIDAEKCNPADV